MKSCITNLQNTKPPLVGYKVCGFTVSGYISLPFVKREAKGKRISLLQEDTHAPLPGSHTHAQPVPSSCVACRARRLSLRSLGHAGCELLLSCHQKLLSYHLLLGAARGRL